MKARQSFQIGYVSDPIRVRGGGVKFVIRYRIRGSGSQWVHKSETLYNLESKKAARSVLQQRITEATNRVPAANELTVHEFVEAYWRPYVERKGLKPSTRMSYESGLKNIILPRLGTVRVLDVSPLHIEELLRFRLQDGVSPKTTRNDLALLQSVFSLAVDNDLISRSPIRKRHKPAISHSEKKVWTAEQIRKIIDAVPAIHRPMFVCAALTGLRLGELLGLQWKYIDLQNDKLEVRQSLWNGKLGSPKTLSSVRTICMGPTLKKALQDQWNSSAYRGPEDFVFCKGRGLPQVGDILRRDVLYPALDRLGIPRSKRDAGFHTFRHSVASFINSETGNLKLAQKLLGHSTISVTGDVYTHVSAREEREAACAVERAIYGDLFQSVPQIENKEQKQAIN